MAKVKVVKIEVENRSKLLRPLWAKSTEEKIEKETEKWVQKGYVLTNTTPVNDKHGETTHYMLTFQKE